MASNEERFILIAMAKNNPNLSDRVIQILMDNSDRFIRNALAENKNIDVSVLEELAKDSWSHIRRNVAINLNTSSNILEKLADDSDLNVRREVAKNPNTSLNTLTKLSQDSDWIILWEISKHPNNTNQLRQQILTKIAEDKSNATSDYRLELAKNIDTDSIILEKLVTFSEIKIRYTLAKRENLQLNLSEKLWSELVNDRDKDNIIVQSKNDANTYISANLFQELDALPFILQNYATSPIPIRRFAAYLHPLLPNSFYQIAAQSLSWLERYAITQNQNTPIKIKQYLTEDANVIVRTAAKANNLSESSFSIPKVPKQKLESKQLLATLNVLIKEWERLEKYDEQVERATRYGYKSFLWLRETQCEFYFANFMKNYSLLNQISLNNLINQWSKQDIKDSKSLYTKPEVTPESAKKCQDLIQLLQNNLINLQSYQVGFHKSEQGFNIIIGQHNNGNWLGLSSLFSDITQKLKPSDIKDTSQRSTEILFLTQQIEAITFDFNPSVKYRYNELGKGIIWEVAASKELLIENLLKTANYIQTETITNQKTHDYDGIYSFLKTYLTNLQTYTFGKNFSYYYEIYTFGQTPAKDWIIFNTNVSSSP